jgi:hypothetical protein
MVEKECRSVSSSFKNATLACSYCYFYRLVRTFGHRFDFLSWETPSSFLWVYTNKSKAMRHAATAKWQVVLRIVSMAMIKGWMLSWVASTPLITTVRDSAHSRA